MNGKPPGTNHIPPPPPPFVKAPVFEQGPPASGFILFPAWANAQFGLWSFKPQWTVITLVDGGRFPTRIELIGQFDVTRVVWPYPVGRLEPTDPGMT